MSLSIEIENKLFEKLNLDKWVKSPKNKDERMEGMMEKFETYVIANLEVLDAEEYRKYEKGFFPILKNIMVNLLPLMTT